MRKLLLSMMFLLFSIIDYADTAPLSACYSIGPDGNVYVKMVFSSPPSQVNFMSPTPVAFNFITVYATYLVNRMEMQDPDNVNWDVVIGTGQPLANFLTDQNGCINIFYCFGPFPVPLLESYYGVALPSITACPCPPAAVVSGGCFSQNSDDSYQIRLVVNAVAMAIDAMAFYGNADYYSIPIFTNSGQILNWANVYPDPDHIDNDYSYNVMAQPSDFDADGCLRLNYTINQQVYYITVCPCCANFSAYNTVGVSTTNPLAINYDSRMSGTWDFGDGSAIVTGITGTHTYASAGTYRVCYTTNDPFGYPCTKCRYVCVLSPDDANISTTQGGDCSSVFGLLGPSNCHSGFTLLYDDGTPSGTPGTFTVVPDVGVISFIIGSNSYTQVPVFTWDGTVGSNTHSFSTDTTHTVCYEVEIYDDNLNLVCTCSQTCMKFCVPAYYKPGGTTGINNTNQNSITAIKLAPNPASDNVTLSFTLEKAANVKVSITDMVGRIVSDIADQQMSAGDRKIDISTSQLASGIYNVSVQINNGITTKRLSVIK